MLFQAVRERILERFGHRSSKSRGVEDFSQSDFASPQVITLDWSKERAFPVFPSVAQSIDVADLTHLTGTEQALLTSLKGLVNRKQPRIYLYWNDDGINKAWLDEIRKYVQVNDLSPTTWRLLEKYRSEVKGAIVYDFDVPDTINLATTLAGNQDCVIASPELAKAHSLPIIQDLRAMFKNRREVYSYGLQKVYPKLNRRLIAAIPPKAGKERVNAILRDYIVATGAPCIWLDPEDREELPLLQQILAILEPNSAYLGWFPHGHEMTGVTEASRKSVYVVASDHLSNGSLMSGLKNFLPGAIPKSVPVRDIKSKIYISLTWSEGDNVQYCQRRLRQLWDHPRRGEIPLGWTITPLLADIAPNILNYFQTTATDNDALVAGPSGAGYTNPIDWPSQDLRIFLDQTRRYTRETGLQSMVWVYNRINGKAVSISRELASLYKDALGPELLGVSTDAHRKAKNPYSVERIEGLAVAGLLQIDNLEAGAVELKKVLQSHFDCTRPLFVACSLTAWNFSIGDVIRMVRTLGEDFEVVRPDEQFEMMARLRQT